MRIPTGEGEGDGDLVNLTPLIDVVFLLLIFFMVTATFQNDERDLTISVPDAENGNPVEDLPEVLTVGIRPDGTFTIGSQVVDREQLRATLVKAKRKNPEQRVIVRADADAPTRFPVVVFDLCVGLDIATAIMTAPGEAR